MAGLLGGVVAGDELDTGGDVDVALAGDDVVGGRADRLEAGRAVARDGRAGGLVTELLAQQDGDPADVVGLQALRKAAAADHFLDERGIDLGVALKELVDDEGGCLVGTQRGQRALEGAPHRGPDDVDDYCFGHFWFLSVVGPAVAHHGR